MEIAKTYHFEAAHRLPNVPETHKCYRLHGHSFVVTLGVEAPVQPECGWVLDFADISGAFAPLLDKLDHHYLNEIDGLENPTSENVAVWIWERMKGRLPALSKVEVRETCTSSAVYRGS